MALNMMSVFPTIQSSSNEFFNSIADKAVINYPITSINTMVDVVNEAAETIAHQLTIPANSAINGIMIKALVAQWIDVGSIYPYTKFRIRVGTTGTTADAEFFLYRIDYDTTVTGNYFFSEWIETKITTLNWSQQQIVSITVDHSAANADLHGEIFYSTVEGF
jgi:hypothetical protein